jgi:hypothetical protein
VARTILFSAAAALLLLTLASPGRPDAPAGEQRLLILRLTWGPETDELSAATIARTVERASVHVSESSYGKTRLTHETTPWLHVWSEEPRVRASASAVGSPRGTSSSTAAAASRSTRCAPAAACRSCLRPGGSGRRSCSRTRGRL